MQKNKLTPMTDEEYIKTAGNVCPVCRKDEVTGEEVVIDGRSASQEVSCLNEKCGASWVDLYELKGYDNLKQ
jgi:hypothetical protein